MPVPLKKLNFTSARCRYVSPPNLSATKQNKLMLSRRWQVVWLLQPEFIYRAVSCLVCPLRSIRRIHHILFFLFFLLDGCVGNRLQCCSVIPSHKSGRLSHTLIAEHRRWLETVVQLLRKWRIWVQVLAESEERGGGLLGVSDVTPAVWICGLWPLWKREMQESLHYVHIQPLCLLTLLPLRWKKAWSHQHLKWWDFGANSVNSYRIAVKSHMFEVNLGKSLAGWPTTLLSNCILRGW